MINISETLREWVPRRTIVFLMMLVVSTSSYVIRAITAGTDRNNVQTNDDLYRKNVTWSHEPNFSAMAFTMGQEPIFSAMAFSFGAMLSSIPAGISAERFGGSNIITAATLASAILSFFAPWYSVLPYTFVLIVRFFIGFCWGAVNPALNALIARWSPPDEKGIFIWTIQCGPLGACLASFLCADIIPDYDWKIVYFISGFMLVFYWLWSSLIYDYPEIHPSIKLSEVEYIKNRIGESVCELKEKFPTKYLITSTPFFVLLCAHLASSWGSYFIPNIIVFAWKSSNFSADYIKVLNMLLHFPALAMGFVFAMVGDFWRRNNILSSESIRQIFILLSHLAPAVCLMVIIIFTENCDPLLNLPRMVLAMLFNSAACQSSLRNQHDLAPNYAGYLYGIMSAISSFFDIIFIFASGLTLDVNGIHDWCIIVQFLVIAYASSMLLFWIWGSSKIQHWNNSNSFNTEDAFIAEEIVWESLSYNLSVNDEYK